MANTSTIEENEVLLDGVYAELLTDESKRVVRMQALLAEKYIHAESLMGEVHYALSYLDGGCIMFLLRLSQRHLSHDGKDSSDVLAEKAWKVLSQKFFLPEKDSEGRDRWSRVPWVLTQPELLKFLIHFFSGDIKTFRRLQMPREFETVRAFLVDLSRQAWNLTYDNYNCEGTEELLCECRPFFIEILKKIDRVDILLEDNIWEKVTDADMKCLFPEITCNTDTSSIRYKKIYRELSLHKALVEGNKVARVHFLLEDLKLSKAVLENIENQKTKRKYLVKA